MKKTMATRNYKLADAILKQKADEFLNLLDRDIEFADRGYNAAAKTQFIALRDDVEVLPSDEKLESQKIELTATKDAARSALEKTMRTIFNMASNRFGSQSAQYRSFGNAEISRLPDAELVRVSKIMIIAANANLAEMATEGLTQAMIDSLTTKSEALDVAIDDVAKGISDRDIATEHRIETLNSLYNLVIKYAGIGQDIFYEVNEAKYNDYVIYDTVDGLPENPPIV